MVLNTQTQQDIAIQDVPRFSLSHDPDRSFHGRKFRQASAGSYLRTVPCDRETPEILHERVVSVQARVRPTDRLSVQCVLGLVRGFQRATALENEPKAIEVILHRAALT